MAVQLGGKKAYDLVAEADAKGVAPHGDVRQILGGFGPAVILMDEVVAYARQLMATPACRRDIRLLPDLHPQPHGGSKAAKNALLVVSIPESDIEIGGEGGKAALQGHSNIPSQNGSVWTPVGAGKRSRSSGAGSS